MHDTSLILKDAGLVDESAAGTVDGSAKIVNLGAGLVEGKMVIDVTALEIASNDEAYRIVLQGSSKSDFADTIEDLADVESVFGQSRLVKAHQVRLANSCGSL